jgi:cyclophilin family peptidyl-prolyl cis-trans isomerase
MGCGTSPAGGTTVVTANANQTLATVTQTASAKVIIGGTASNTFDAVAQTAGGIVKVTANGSATLETVTQAAAGTLTIGGSGSATLATVTQTANAQVIVTAGANQTLDTITQVAGSSSVSNGTAAQTLEAVSQTAAGRVTVTGYAAAGLATVTQVAAGELGTAGPTSVGTAHQTLDDIGQRARGDQYDPGNPWAYAKQQRDRRAREKAKRAASGQFAQMPHLGRHVVTLGNVTAQARGVTKLRLGRASQTLAGLASSGSGYVLPVISGQAHGRLGDATQAVVGYASFDRVAAAHGVLEGCTQAAAGWAPTILDERDMLIAELRDLRDDYEEVRQWVNILAA